MKIAFFSPLPPTRSGIADYSAGLISRLKKYAQIDLWVDADDDIDDTWFKRFNYVRDPALLAALDGYDAILYHLGNSSVHANIYRVFLDYPGTVVLHDFILHHFFATYFLDQRSGSNLYIEEMAYSHGIEGRTVAEKYISGQTPPPWERAPFSYPLNKRVLDKAQGIIVHSQFVRKLIAAVDETVPVRVINLYADVLNSAKNSAELRRSYRLPQDKLIVASLGFATPAKRLTTTLRALERLGRNDVLYLIVGDLPKGSTIGSNRLVRTTGYVTSSEFADYLSLIDICVSLRWPTMGETSSTVCRVLGAGKPCIVSDVGWFSELPDDCAVKVRIDDREEEALAFQLEGLLENADRRALIGANAKRFIGENHDADFVARDYVDFLRATGSLKSRDMLKRRFVKSIGTELVGLGITEADDGVIMAVAQRLASALSVIG
jgi:glycosyltransferase involved in cell wall biosynthesis